MEFEFDDEKSRKNEEKHGISFIEAQVIWEDGERVEIPAKTDDEPRFLVIGQIDGKYWSAVVTYRNNKTRIISVRRARREEIHIYES